MYNSKILAAAVACVLLSACIAKKDIILPTRYDREMLQARYGQCISQATNNYYDDVRAPEAIVRTSFNLCKGSRSAMLKDYPRRWQENYAKEIDEEIYKREIAWIQGKRH